MLKVQNSATVTTRSQTKIKSDKLLLLLGGGFTDCLFSLLSAVVYFPLFHDRTSEFSASCQSHVFFPECRTYCTLSILVKFSSPLPFSSFDSFCPNLLREHLFIFFRFETFFKFWHHRCVVYPRDLSQSDRTFGFFFPVSLFDPLLC